MILKFDASNSISQSPAMKAGLEHYQNFLITGGTRGIGKALTEHFLRLGKRVAITGRSSENVNEALAELKGEVQGFPCEMTDVGAVSSLVSTVEVEMGPIDVVINNAAVTGEIGSFLDADPTDFWNIQKVNLQAPTIIMNHALKGMVERNRGCVFNVGSYAAVKQLPGNPAYGVSKVALARLTDLVAMELENTGVSVFTVSPGLVLTDMTRDVPLFKDIPDSVWSKPTDICRLLNDMLERDCSPLNGRFLHVNDDLDKILDSLVEVETNKLYLIGMNGMSGRI